MSEDTVVTKTRKLPSKQQLIRGTALVATGAVATLVIISVTKKAPVLDVAAAVADTTA